MTDYPLESTCVACGMRLPASVPEDTRTRRFCPYCGSTLDLTTPPSRSQSYFGTTAWSHEGTISLPRGRAPTPEEVRFSIGPFQVLSSLGKGGMGEVFLAYDPTCGRRIALKRIREDLVDSQQLHSRFLKEARLTSQLTHPAIIPIYSIHISEKLIYYTMPYVEGETLKQILRTTRVQEKKSQQPHPIGSSIPTLIRIFMSLCQAVAYAHAEGVLHRDLKPENVMIGNYGQVMILDWGLAKLFDSPEEILPANKKGAKPSSTRLGRIVGTATYIAPERALGQPATAQSEIYALGVILYQLLTLQMPFGRKTMKDLRKTMTQGVFLDPAEIAPYREVPPMLSQIASKCLAFNVEQRYQTVSALICDLELYMEGRSEWLQTTSLDIHRKGDWEFQENVLLARHIEITRHTEEVDWVNLMISRSSFPGNCMLEGKICLKERGHGLGFLLNVPEAGERVHLTDGYCVWIGSEQARDTKLLRSTVEVMSAPDSFLKPNVWVDVRIEKVDSNIHFSLNNQLQFSYNSPLPMGGTHVGLVCRDADFSLKDLRVYCGSQNLTVSCMAVPDAFLAHKYHAAALAEYRRIAYSFPGRSVGREALLSAGITLLDQGRSAPSTAEAASFYDLALVEFGKLHNTPGAPLEYLGKALVYQAQEEYEEEVKCFELALRRYYGHPLLHMIQDRIIHRLHESSHANRLAAYHFALLVVQHLPAMGHLPNAKKLFSSMQGHWEPLPFLSAIPSDDNTNMDQYAISLAFWVAKPYALAETTQAITSRLELDVDQIRNALFSLIEIGSWRLARKLLTGLCAESQTPGLTAALAPLELAIRCHEASPMECVEPLLNWSADYLTVQQEQILVHIVEQALSLGQSEVASTLLQQFSPKDRDTSPGMLLEAYHIWTLLLKEELSSAGEILHAYPIETLSDEQKPFHLLYGCFLVATEGRELASIHFSGAMDLTYPRLWALLGHYVTGKITETGGWLAKAFLWEKRHLYRQLSLFHHCAGRPRKAEEYRKLERSTYLDFEP